MHSYQFVCVVASIHSQTLQGVLVDIEAAVLKIPSARIELHIAEEGTCFDTRRQPVQKVGCDPGGILIVRELSIMAGAFWNWSHDIQEDGVDVFLYDKAQNIIQVLSVARRAESWRANNTTMIQQNLWHLQSSCRRRRQLIKAHAT